MSILGIPLIRNVLSLGWHFDQIAVERAMKVKEEKAHTKNRTRRSRSPATAASKESASVGVREPQHFQSIP